MKKLMLKLKCKLRGVIHIIMHEEYIVMSVEHKANGTYDVAYSFKMKASDVVDAMDTVRPIFEECEHLDETLHIAQRILLEASAPK